MDKFRAMASKVYKQFLWFAGFLAGEQVTDMLRRQRDRLGIWYYLLIGSSLLLLNLLLVRSIQRKAWGWLIVWIFVDIFLIWLLPHIYGYTIIF